MDVAETTHSQELYLPVIRSDFGYCVVIYVQYKLHLFMKHRPVCNSTQKILITFLIKAAVTICVTLGNSKIMRSYFYGIKPIRFSFNNTLKNTSGVDSV